MVVIEVHHRNRDVGDGDQAGIRGNVRVGVVTGGRQHVENGGTQKNRRNIMRMKQAK